MERSTAFILYKKNSTQTPKGELDAKRQKDSKSTGRKTQKTQAAPYLTDHPDAADYRKRCCAVPEHYADPGNRRRLLAVCRFGFSRFRAVRK